MKAGARTGPGENALQLQSSDTGLGRDGALPLVDCKWQSKFTLTAGAGMGSDSFVRESERLSGRAGIWMISPPFISKSQMYVRKSSMATRAREHTRTHTHAQ